MSVELCHPGCLKVKSLHHAVLEIEDCEVQAAARSRGSLHAPVPGDLIYAHPYSWTGLHQKPSQQVW